MKRMMEQNVNMQKIVEVGRKQNDNKRMIVVKLGSKKKKQIMKKRAILKDRKERIENDWTHERKGRCNSI